MNKKLKLTKLTVANLERIKGGDDPVCFCQAFGGTIGDEAFNQNGYQTILSCKVCVLTQDC